ncbi:MAG: hypothetical protein LBD82_07375 [Deltaproteobacteria bacterium]|jgi:hypothetical protein|nr:hypothetical protein [Deltaproteobacteria bacterium]
MTAPEDVARMLDLLREALCCGPASGQLSLSPDARAGLWVILDLCSQALEGDKA